LSQFVFRSGMLMKPMFEAARRDPRRVVFAEGEDERVLRAAQAIVDDGLAKPILIGRREVVGRRIERLGLRIRPGEHFELVDPQSDARYNEYWTLYHRLMERRGVSPEIARTMVRTRTAVIGALMVKRGEADALICGTAGRYERQLRHILEVIGLKRGVKDPAALSVLIVPRGTFFLADTYVTPDPDAEQIAEMTLLASEAVERFGIKPKVALLSHSSFGTADTPSARKMRAALALVVANRPDLEVDGEMPADAALSEEIRARIFPNSRLKGQANLLILPDLDAANIAFNLVKVVADGLAVGPILIGVAQPAHILTPSVTVRGIVNMTAVAVVEAQGRPSGWMDGRGEAAAQPGARR
jgi:malate dehydrogenase (oxaloacetate-decarboxylating)(NADP+)